MFQRISIQNYKSIKTLENFELKPVNILIGANNSGKSNFLDVFAFLRDTLADDDLQKPQQEWINALEKRGGGDAVCFTGTKTFRITCYSDPFRYSLEIGLDSWGQHYQIRGEKLENDAQPQKFFEPQNGMLALYDENGRNIGSKSPFNQTRLRVFLDENSVDQRARDFAKKLSNIKIYDRIRTEKWSPIRLPQISKGETVLDEDGGNLIGVLHQLAQIQPRFLPDLNVSLKALFSDFSRIAFPSNEEGRLDIRWEDANGRVLNSSQLSDGTLKFLCLIAILRNPNPPAFIGLDEPEARLHPKMMGILVDMIEAASQKTQIIATTHNPDFISNFSPEKIVILQQYHGETEMRRFSDKGALELWLQDFGTRELWLMGELESRW